MFRTRWCNRRFLRLGTTVFILIVFVIFIYLFTYDYEVDGWSRQVSRNVTDYIDPHSRFRIIPEDMCKSESYLMIVVCSAPDNFKARNAIRDTWGSIPDDIKVKVYFLLGETTNEDIQNKIEEESETHNDIVQEHFIDTYNNLTLKSIALMKLVTNYCTKSVQFVMKCDDDTFINLEFLLQMIEKRNITQNLLVGYKMCKITPMRFVFDKWYMALYMYPDKIYPDYLSGTGYVMSADVPPALIKTAIQTPILHLEDVYLTGICAKKLNIKSIHDERFHHVKFDYEPCLYQHLITTHYLNPNNMRKLYETLQVSNPKEECASSLHGTTNKETNTPTYKEND